MHQADDGNRLVSIIMPVYNKERFIKESIISILNQTYSNWELLLIDDCSTDHSPDIITEFIKQDSRIRAINLEVNSGAAVARNIGIENAKGRFIAFLDADDLWLPQKLERQIDFMNKGQHGFTYTAIEMIDGSGKIIKGKREIKREVGYRQLLSNTMIACSSVVIDRVAIGEFRMPLVRKGQDYATWLSILRKGVTAYGLNEVLVRYRLIKGSISSNKLKALQRTWRVYRNQEQLGFFTSLFYFSQYAFNAAKKYFFK